MKHFFLIFGLIIFAISANAQVVTESKGSIIVNTENYTIAIEKVGFRYEFRRPDGKVIASAHGQSGIQIGSGPGILKDVIKTSYIGYENQILSFKVYTIEGVTADVKVDLQPNWARFSVEPEGKEKYSIIGRTGGITPAFGLADHSIVDVHSSDVTGFKSENFTSRGGDIRLISNFVIFPERGFANINIEPSPKIVRVTEQENVQGVLEGSAMPSLYYFIGSPYTIYQSLREVRNIEGYPLKKPKYRLFGVGWEAFGALAWNTNEKSVRENINQYFELDFPLQWMVIGSGYWPGLKDEFDEEGFRHGTQRTGDETLTETEVLQATTSFGLWDKQKYPDPEGMIAHFKDHGLTILLGLRIGFIPGGPFTGEGLENNYFIKDDEGKAKLFDVSFPVPPVYLLDAKNQEATDWYVELSQRWLDYGIDGFKEDLFGYPGSLPNDFIDPVNRTFMKRGIYVMGRNMYFGSPADIHRFNDFNYNQLQDRGPINGLAYAYSGFPYVYPDISGGTGLATGRFGDEPKDRLAVYLMRYAEYSALHPVMSFGYGPWNFGDEVVRVTRNAAMLHDRLQPYTYSYSIKAYETGFPYPMTPLPLAYPDDPGVYGLADTTRRSYQWLIGESLLATPLYGDDYTTATSRDVYLPEGTWVEYDNGEIHQGPTTLNDYPLPIGKTPLFVGGSGIVVEKINGELKGRLYPVNSNADMVFFDKDGETRSTITIANPDWENPAVVNQSTGKRLSGSWSRHAYEFLFTPGNNYRVE